MRNEKVTDNRRFWVCGPVAACRCDIGMLQRERYCGDLLFFLGALWLGKAIYMLRQNRRNYNKTEIEVEKNG